MKRLNKVIPLRNRPTYDDDKGMVNNGTGIVVVAEDKYLNGATRYSATVYNNYLHYIKDVAKPDNVKELEVVNYPVGLTYSGNVLYYHMYSRKVIIHKSYQ